MSDPEHYDHSSVDVWEDEGGDNDDVWGNDDDVSYDRAIAQKEWDRLHENFGNVRDLSLSLLSLSLYLSYNNPYFADQMPWCFSEPVGGSTFFFF